MEGKVSVNWGQDINEWVPYTYSWTKQIKPVGKNWWKAFYPLNPPNLSHSKIFPCMVIWYIYDERSHSMKLVYMTS